MTVKLSTGLRNAIVSNHGLGIMMQRGIILLYDGVQPETPDNPPSGALLAKVTTGGKTFIPGSDPNNAGLLLSLVSPGTLTNNGSWRIKGVQFGTADWWRWVWFYDDPQTDSTFYPRVDGQVGESFILAARGITPLTDVPMDGFRISLPMGAA